MIKGFVNKVKLKPVPPRHVETYCGYDIVYEKGRYIIFQNSLAIEWNYSRASAKDWINLQMKKKKEKEGRDWLVV